MNVSLLANQTGHSHLRRLFLLRSWAILAQLATLLLVHRFLSTDFAWGAMLGVVGSMALLNGLTWWRLSLNYPVSHLELFLQLSLDVLALSVLLYFGGGSTNPFVSLYLLPLVLAAATLPRRYTWGMAALTLACYSLLMVWYVPLPTGNAHAQHDHAVMQMDHGQHQMQEPAVTYPLSNSDGTTSHSTKPASGQIAGYLPQAGESTNEKSNVQSPDYCRTQPEAVAQDDAPSPLEDAFNTHVLGMWLGFVISAAVIAYFAVEMASAVRLRDAQLNRVREETLRNERIVSLGTLAASAAHELGTPLSTMSVVIGEMRGDCTAPEQKDNLHLLDEQVKNCKRILDTLIRHAQETPDEQNIESFVFGVLDEWQLLRPTVHYRYQVSGAHPAPQLRADAALRAALLNLLNNAADASADEMDILLRWDNQYIVLEIRDHGPGLTPEAAARAGTAFFTTKQEGRGLGLFLANATVERMGGSVRVFNREGGGATTEVIMPLRGTPT